MDESLRSIFEPTLTLDEYRSLTPTRLTFYTPDFARAKEQDFLKLFVPLDEYRALGEITVQWNKPETSSLRSNIRAIPDFPLENEAPTCIFTRISDNTITATPKDANGDSLRVISIEEDAHPTVYPAVARWLLAKNPQRFYLPSINETSIQMPPRMPWNDGEYLRVCWNRGSVPAHEVIMNADIWYHWKKIFDDYRPLAAYADKTLSSSHLRSNVVSPLGLPPTLVVESSGDERTPDRAPLPLASDEDFPTGPSHLLPTRPTIVNAPSPPGFRPTRPALEDARPSHLDPGSHHGQPVLVVESSAENSGASRLVPLCTRNVSRPLGWLPRGLGGGRGYPAAFSSQSAEGNAQDFAAFVGPTNAPKELHVKRRTEKAHAFTLTDDQLDEKLDLTLDPAVDAALLAVLESCSTLHRTPCQFTREENSEPWQAFAVRSRWTRGEPASITYDPSTRSALRTTNGQGSGSNGRGR